MDTADTDLEFVADSLFSLLNSSEFSGINFVNMLLVELLLCEKINNKNLIDKADTFKL